MNKTKLALVYGGKSQEHTISIMSAKQVQDNINKEKYDVRYFAIDVNGVMFETEGVLFEEQIDHKKEFSFEELSKLKEFDVVFPILHGPFGEDGKIQGLLDTLDIKYVGENQYVSSLCMDKDILKRVLKYSGIDVVDWTMLRKGEDYKNETRNYPLFVKPARLGSSIGITKVKKSKDFKLAFSEAFLNDDKLIIEEAIKGRELEIAFLNGRVSTVGEVLPSQEYYDYEAKYFDDGKSKIIIPANIDKNIEEQIKSIALKIAYIVGIKSISRLDFFLSENQNLYLNEVNTMPGFTEFSMYAMLFEKEGLTKEKIIDMLIEKALEV